MKYTFFDALLKVGESKTLEFKRDLSSLQPVIKTIAAFANTSGGMMVIGIEDKTKEPIGLADIELEEERLANAIATAFTPQICPHIEKKCFKDKNFLFVHVERHHRPIHIGLNRTVYIRIGSLSCPANRETVRELYRKMGPLSFDKEPLYQCPVDFLKDREWTLENLRSFGALELYQTGLIPTVGGLLLFGDQHQIQRWAPSLNIRLACFLSRKKNFKKCIDFINIQGNLFEVFLKIKAFIFQHTRKKIYSKVALEEAVINALVHADYSLSGSGFYIGVFSNRITIQNPGILSEGLTINDVKNGISQIRNPVLARLFSESGLMKCWGSGYERLMKGASSGRYKAPVIEEIGRNVRVTIYFSPNQGIKK